MRRLVSRNAAPISAAARLFCEIGLIEVIGHCPNDRIHGVVDLGGVVRGHMLLCSQDANVVIPGASVEVDVAEIMAYGEHTFGRISHIDNYRPLSWASVLGLRSVGDQRRGDVGPLRRAILRTTA